MNETVYKLSPEEIRKRAKEIALGSISTSWEVSAIINLLEDATGEKLFEDSNVEHGSVWSNGTLTVLFMSYGTNLIGIRLDMGHREFVYNSGDFSFAEKSVQANRLSNWQFKYLGQYDFSAGIPK